MILLRLLLPLAALFPIAGAASAAEIYLDYGGTGSSSATGAAGSGQTFFPMDATGYAGEAVLYLTHLDLWTGCNGGGDPVTYVAIYDGDPDLPSSTLVGTSTNSIDTAVMGCYATDVWDFNSLPLNPAIEHWAVLSNSTSDDNATTIVGKSLLGCNTSYPNGSALYAGRTPAPTGADIAFKATFEVPDEPGVRYCFGNTASGNPCPCGNDNDGTDALGAGCAHDDSTAGAALYASGTASITSDSLLLEGMRGPISNSSLFFQANNSLDTNGVFLGDGIRCAGGGLIRLKVKLTNATGYADSSPAVVSTRSASFGHTITAGETLYYQWWFRDVNGSPCGSESNTSNGYMITWTP